MSDAIELALVLLACTTPILAIMWLDGYLKRLKQRNKVAEEQSATHATQLAELRQRIEILETIVTDKSYQLDQELRAVGRQGRG
jgi:hypothetical protein